MSDKVLCLYHGNGCTDGYAAAWAVRRALGDGVEFHAASYGGAVPDVRDRDVLMVDFSYKRPVIDEMSRSAKSILILDHHKSAAEDLRGLIDVPKTWQEWIFAARGLGRDAAGACPAASLFDMERSGAGIAWDYLHPGASRPALIGLVEVRDLWRRADPLWDQARAAHAYVNSFPFDFEQWDLHVNFFEGDESGRLIEEGDAILRQHDINVAAAVSATTRWMVIGSIEVPVCNLPRNMTSDGCAVMLEHFPVAEFVASYYDGRISRYFDLRSSDDRMDVSRIAVTYGGGGHRNAAGFKVPRDHPLASA